MSETKRHYKLPDLPTVCPCCGAPMSESAPFAQVQTAYMKFYACPEEEHGTKLFSVVASRDHISGSRVWIVDEV